MAKFPLLIMNIGISANEDLMKFVITDLRKSHLKEKIRPVADGRTFVKNPKPCSVVFTLSALIQIKHISK